MSFTTAELIAEAERELRQRERVYPRLVAAGRLKVETASRQMRLQLAIIAALQEREESERLI